MTRALVSAVVLAAAVGVAGAQPSPPELTAPVNDFAGVLSPQVESALDTLIRKLQSATGDVMVVATIKTFQPAPDLATYANEMFENHGRGIGQNGRDNGLLVVLAVDDRGVRAEVGYDLEGIITDGFAGETSRQVMVPYFRKNDFGGGLVAGATRFAERIAEARGVTLDGQPIRRTVESDRDGGFPIIFIIFLAIIIINAIRGSMNAGSRRRRGRRWGSGVGPFGTGYGGWSSGGGGFGAGGGFGGGFGGFGGGRSGGGGGGASW